MKLNYYLRGLGIGILVTAAILSFAASDRSDLSDEEIMARASELGMTEGSAVLSELEETGEDSQQSEAAEQSADETVQPSDAEASPLPQESLAEESLPEPLPSTSENPTVSTEETDAPATAGMGLPAEDIETGNEAEDNTDENAAGGSRTEGEEVTIEIASGESSYLVCVKLEEAGLIVSAGEYDTYLCENGYDKIMRSGSHQIPAGADSETIAGILSGRL